MIKKITAFSIFSILLIACSVSPQEINYGTDACNYCKMNVVSKQHSAQYVTKKGKQHKFDAIECMVNDINAQNHEDILAYTLVAVYDTNEENRTALGTMINAKEASYLICEKIQSPMGANLSAYKRIEDAEEMTKKFGGEIYTWESLKKKFKARSN